MIVQEVTLSLPHAGGDEKLVAVADVVVVGKLAVHGIKLISSDGRLFLSMPSTPMRKRCVCGGQNSFAAKFCNWCGTGLEKVLFEGGARPYSEVVHPIDQASRRVLTETVVERYEQQKDAQL